MTRLIRFLMVGILLFFAAARPALAEQEILRDSETELLFTTIVHEVRSVLDLLDADYTFVDERLARHYGIPDIHGSYFRRIALDPASPRRGLLGQGSMLTVTSVATRTSPVSRRQTCRNAGRVGVYRR